MGLDQYAYATNEELVEQIDFETPKTRVEIQYWRKHPDLHGWMAELYREKGGMEEFNCVPVVLTSQDIDELEKAIEDRALPKTDGFFFGESTPDDYFNDIKFIQRARQAIEAGMTVYYNSWW